MRFALCWGYGAVSPKKIRIKILSCQWIIFNLFLFIKENKQNIFLFNYKKFEVLENLFIWDFILWLIIKLCDFYFIKIKNDIKY